MSISKDQIRYRVRTITAFSMGLAAITLTSALMGCGNSSPRNKEDPGSNSQPEVRKELSTKCFEALSPPIDGTIGTLQMIDGEEGSYELISLESTQKLSNPNGSLEMGLFSDGTNVTEGAVNNSLPTASITCAQETGNLERSSFENFVSLPMSIQRRDGKLGQFLRVTGNHYGIQLKSKDQAQAKLTNEPIGTLMDLMPVNSSYSVSLYRLSADRVMIFVTSQIMNADKRELKSKIAGTYAYRGTPSRRPGNVAPEGTSSPGIQGNARLDLAVNRTFTPHPHRNDVTQNTRCGVRGLNITIDGRDAFSLPSESDRNLDLKVLISIGFCAEPSRLGVDGTYITLDGERAFMFTEAFNRMVELSRLFDSGAGSRDFIRCSVSGTIIYVDGKAKFQTSYDMERAETLVRMMESGACSYTQ